MPLFRPHAQHSDCGRCRFAGTHHFSSAVAPHAPPRLALSSVKVRDEKNPEFISLRKDSHQVLTALFFTSCASAAAALMTHQSLLPMSTPPSPSPSRPSTEQHFPQEVIDGPEASAEFSATMSASLVPDSFGRPLAPNTPPRASCR
jgi:hypothetical protein